MNSRCVMVRNGDDIWFFCIINCVYILELFYSMVVISMFSIFFLLEFIFFLSEI